MRPLHQGEVGVSFYREETENSTRREFDRQILPESELVLVDRTFHRGDFCKRSIDDVRSGVVMRSRVDGRCEHVVSGERIDGWTRLEELSDRTYAEVGDYVTYDDWIGQVRAYTRITMCPVLTRPPGNRGMICSNLSDAPITRDNDSYTTKSWWKLPLAKSFGFQSSALDFR